MRVSIQHRDAADGLIFKKRYHEVCTTVDFSEEELAVIKQGKLGKTIVLERVPCNRVRERLGNLMDNYEPSFWFLRIEDLVKKRPEVWACDNPAQVNGYEEELTAALKQLKVYIEGNSVKPESKTFEI